MRVLTTVVLTSLVAFGGGFLAGRAGAPEASAAPAPEPPARLRPVLPASNRGLVCLRPNASRNQDQTLEILAPALELCESRLDRSEHRGKFRRHDWPAEGVETPDAWANAVEESLEACGIDLGIELVECTEYPCLAAFRPPADADERGNILSGAYSKFRENVERQLAECEPLREAFGIPRPEDASAFLEVWAYDAPCEGAAEPVMILSALDVSGPATEARRDGSDTNEELRWTYRRAEDVAAAWRCADGG